MVKTHLVASLLFIFVYSCASFSNLNMPDERKDIVKNYVHTDTDGFITVDEVYSYVSTKVKEATGQRQHPLKKGSVEGDLVLGIVK